MNIFVVDRDPEIAARSLCDKHVSKMTLETAQILCAAFDDGMAPYRKSHARHVCTRWALHSKENYEWLIEHGLALGDEFKFRYGKDHKSTSVIQWAKNGYQKKVGQDFIVEFEGQGQTEFVQAMPVLYLNPDPVIAYRSYYVGGKSWAVWKDGRPPLWWKKHKSFYNESGLKLAVEEDLLPAELDSLLDQDELVTFVQKRRKYWDKKQGVKHKHDYTMADVNGFLHLTKA